MADMPVAEVDIDIELVAGLLGDQHPDLAGRPALAVAYLAGSDDNHVIASIGRRTLAAALADEEHP